jgi:hypothetical protein
MSIALHVLSIGVLVASFFLSSVAKAECVCRCTNGQNVHLCTNALDIPPHLSAQGLAYRAALYSTDPVPAVAAARKAELLATAGIESLHGNYEWQRLCR